MHTYIYTIGNAIERIAGLKDDNFWLNRKYFFSIEMNNHCYVYKYVKTFLWNEKWVWRDAEKTIGINGGMPTSPFFDHCYHIPKSLPVNIVMLDDN